MTRFGYRPSPFDGRDYVWDRIDATVRHAELRRGRVWNQREVPCCTSMAVTAAMESLDGQFGAIEPLSPLFHYFFSRPSPAHLGDVTLRSALETAVYPGVCRLELHQPPMDRDGALTRPNQEAILDAELRRLVGYDYLLGQARYYSLDTHDRVASWRSALAAGFPVIFGFWVTEEYQSGEGVSEAPPEPSTIAHAVMAYGYRDATAEFLVHDSRGIAFGNQGTWSLAYAAVQSRLVIESWCLEAIIYDT
jgi:hypothetical protein